MANNDSNYFPLEKILTVRAGDYIQSTSKSLRDYEIIGVNIKSSVDDFSDFRRGVPSEAEVVVDFKRVFAGEWAHGKSVYDMGTALVPKPKR